MSVCMLVYQVFWLPGYLKVYPISCLTVCLFVWLSNFFCDYICLCFCLFIYLSACLPAIISVDQSVECLAISMYACLLSGYISACLFIYPTDFSAICLPFCLPAFLIVKLSFCLSVFLSFCPSIWQSDCIFAVCSSICPSIHQFVHLSFC